MRGLNCCGEISIRFVPDGLVSGTRKKTMWAVLADGAPVVRKENPQFPEIDNARALSLVWQANQLNLLLDQLNQKR